jgi:hypothetical protein
MRAHQCRRCGARRVHAYYSNLDSPVTPGWPNLVNRHGGHVYRTRWVTPPAEGWPDTDHLRIRVSPPQDRGAAS